VAPSAELQQSQETRTDIQMMGNIHLMANLQDKPGKPVPECLALWILLELRMTEVVVTTGAIRRANYGRIIITNQHAAFYRPDALPVTQITVSAH